MDVLSAPAMTDGAIEVAIVSFLVCLGNIPLIKNRERGRYICKLVLDRSGPSWLSSIAVSMRPAARRDIKFMSKNVMWNCSQKGVT